MAMSFLMKIAEQYLVHSALFADEVKVKTKLAEVYRQRGLAKHFERTMRAAQDVQASSPLRNAEFFTDDYHVQMEQYRFAATTSRTAEHNLQAITDNLDMAYFAQKLRQACLLLSHQAVYKTAYQFGMLDEVLAHVETQQLLGIPAIAGAGILKLGDALASGETISFSVLLTAILTFFVALGTITILMKMVRHMSFLPFAVYRILLGIVLLGLIYSGMPFGAVN